VTIKKLLAKVAESVIYASGTVTTLVVLFIIYFLFQEGSGLFGKPAIEEGYSIVLNKFNMVEKLNPVQVKKIFEGDYHNWQQLGGNYDSIYTFTLSDVEYKFTAEELGENYEHLGEKIEEYINNNTGVIACLPDKYINKSLIKTPVDPIALSSILKGKEWYPTAMPSPQFGALPLILGSFLVSFLAILMAIPLGLSVAVYMAEIADPNVRNIAKTVIELLAGIPSVVFGFFGLVVVVPFIKDLFGLSIGETALSGSVILAIISLPTIISVSEDAIRSVPQELKNASLALGANHLQTIVLVILPYSASGIISAAILGVGRAFGETMAVLMVTGNSAIMPSSIFEPVRTITATIAAELGEAQSGGLHYKALFILGSILFIITFIFNLIAEMFMVKRIS
jgi:phosphate transport system permease protein